MSTLDAMRGIAAASVVLFHEGDLFAPFSQPSAYLAVDFFFVLSGFVLESAYGGELGSNLSWTTFIFRRYVRFWPVAAAGVVLGAATFALLYKAGHAVMAVPDIATAAALNIFLLPAPPWVGSGALYPVDGPLWSLLFELLVNALFALFYKRLTTGTLVVAIMGSGIGLITWALLFGTIDAGPEWSQFCCGFTRVVFSFSVGVCLFRVRLSHALPSLLAPALLGCILTIFCLPAGYAVLELVAVLVAFPLLVWVGAAVNWNPLRISSWLGRLSFPIYAVHLPFFTLFAAAWGATIGHSAKFAPLSGVLTSVGCLAFCLGLDRLIDAPVRRLLQTRFRNSASQVVRGDTIG